MALFSGGSLVNPSGLDWAAFVESSSAERAGNYRAMADYYAGLHRVPVPEKARVWLERHYGFRGNLCDVITDALAERLVVTGFDTTDPAQAEKAWTWWRQNRMDHDSRVAHKEAAKLGDFYVLVDWDQAASRPRFTLQGPSQVYPHYADRELDYAVKVWDVGKDTRRFTVYYPDHIERYVAVRSSALWGSGWGPPKLYGPEGGVTDWTGPNNEPLGVPVVHIRNNAQSDDFGRSEIAQVIPLQDLLNKTLVDLALVMDTMGFPQRWATGPTPFGHEWSVQPGRVWKSDDPDAKFGQFDAAAPGGLLATLLFLVNFSAGRSRTPQHLFHIEGDYPTGEALKTAEAGFIAKVEDRSVTFGGAWERLLQIAYRLDNAFGVGSWDPDAIIETLWRPYELRNEQAHAQAIASLQNLYPRRALWRMNGATPLEIGKLEEEWNAQAAADLERQRQVSGNLLGSFNAGA